MVVGVKSAYFEHFPIPVLSIYAIHREIRYVIRSYMSKGFIIISNQVLLSLDSCYVIHLITQAA